MLKKIIDYLKTFKAEVFVFVSSFLFSFWLMFSTFLYEKGYILIASKAWSDFASHIPLIRSFSLGINFPPQYPLFAGAPIKYHFLFYALTGLAEKSGIRIDIALNIFSALGFFFLLIMIYVFSKELFKSKAIGVLSILFFIFNGTLEFIKFFVIHPISVHSISDIIENQKFVSFGPYDGSIISAFWNLNIYTNQRHLALSYALSLFLIYLILKLDNNKANNIKKSVLVGIILGASFFLNIAVFIMTILILGSMFLLMRKKRVCIFIVALIASILAFPQYLYLQSGGSNFQPLINPGYLVLNLSFLNFLSYWIQNLGLHIFLIPLGFIVATKNERKILISFFTLFIVGNLIQFSPEIAANHKFFNYFMIIGVMFSAYCLTRLWRRRNIFKPIVIILIFFSMFSGIIDFFPIANDNKIALADYPVNKNVAWIIKNTNPNSVFLNTQYLYDDASLAGKKIFLGWPYFAWSQGYDTNKRGEIRNLILTATDKKLSCDLLTRNKIDYIEISPVATNSDNPQISNMYIKSFVTIYHNGINGYRLLSVTKSCL